MLRRRASRCSFVRFDLRSATRCLITVLSWVGSAHHCLTVLLPCGGHSPPYRGGRRPSQLTDRRAGRHGWSALGRPAVAAAQIVVGTLVIIVGTATGPAQPHAETQAQIGELALDLAERGPAEAADLEQIRLG